MHVKEGSSVCLSSFTNLGEGSEGGEGIEKKEGLFQY